jgi:hypothetical protein
MLHIHFYLRVVLAIRKNGRSLRTFQKKDVNIIRKHRVAKSCRIHSSKNCSFPLKCFSLNPQKFCYQLSWSSVELKLWAIINQSSCLVELNLKLNILSQSFIIYTIFTLMASMILLVCVRAAEKIDLISLINSVKEIK